MKVKAWLRSGLWSSIGVSVLAGMHLSRSFAAAEELHGHLYATLLLLFILVLLGAVIGTVLWAIGLAADHWRKKDPAEIPRDQLIGLGAVVVCLAAFGNWATLLLFVLFKAGLWAVAKYRSRVVK